MLNVIYAELRRRRFMKKVFIAVAIVLCAIATTISIIIHKTSEEEY